MTKTEELRKKSMALPEQPGVYLMKNAAGKIIYIGKAKNLKNRVSQYFGAQNNHTSKVRKMVQTVSDFDYIIVGSEFEALVLECSLIKQNKPKYNILLKDDKGYHYIKLSQGSWKTLCDVKQKTEDGAQYFGPYTSNDAVSSAVKQALDIFRLPHCAKRFPEDIKRSGRPCLNYYIKLCSGACCGHITREEHNETVDEALKFVLGGKTAYLRTLHAQMQAASENLEFEKAAKLRDRIRGIEKVAQKQYVVSAGEKNQDVFGLASLGEKTCICVLVFREGTLTNTQTFIIDRMESTDEEYPEMLANYYTSVKDFPQRICIGEQLSQRDFLEQFFSETAGRRVQIFVPKAGEPKTLLAMAEKNAGEKLARAVAANDKFNAALYELKEVLHLDTLPCYIEAYDISNTAGEENVCGMVTFVDGRPFKRGYRKFEIKSFVGQDDYRSLAEVLERRILEFQKADQNASDGFGKKPDLILLDGGLGQVNAVQPVLDRYDFQVPLFGMVKDSGHRTRAIASGGGEIMISDKRIVFSLISRIQEEVHRYAVSYHHRLKKKHTLGVTLTQIPGVGEKRAKLLLARFQTVDAVRHAEFDELCSVPGIPRTTAESIYAYFHDAV